MRIRYLACLLRGKKKKKKEKREKKNQSQRKKKKNFAIQYTGFEKLATMGYKAFSSSALYSLYIHPRTDYHTDLRMSLPLESITSCIDEWIGLNRGLHTVHYESSNPNPIRRIDPILYPTRVCYPFEFQLSWRDRRADFCSIIFEIFLKMSNQLANRSN